MLTQMVSGRAAQGRIAHMNTTLATLKSKAKAAKDAGNVGRQMKYQRKLDRTTKALKHLQKVANDPTKVMKIVGNVGKVGKFFLTLGKLFNVAGWIWLAYDVGSYLFDWYASYERQKIHTASLLAGDNQLCWLPLEYQGNEYVAGLEGIVGGLRSANTMMYGELSMEDGGNRFFYVLDNLTMKEAAGFFDQDPRRI